MESRSAFSLQVNIKGKHGRTALYLAAEGNKLCHSVDVCPDKLSPIAINVPEYLYMFFAGGHIFIVKLLLQHPDIDVNSRY